MQIQFIQAQEKDAHEIAWLRQLVWASTYRGIYPDEMIDSFDYAWHAERDALKIKSSAYEVYLIKSGEESIGYMILQKTKPLLLQSLYVLSQYQRCGIGRQAFEYLRKYCEENRHTEFSCHCQPENENAMRFYRKMGGVKVGEDVANEESWQDSVILSFAVDRR